MLFRMVRNSKKVDAHGQIAVIGTLSVSLPETPSTFQCFTLEREAVIVPARTYFVELTVSDRAQRGELWTPFNDPANALSAVTALRDHLPQLMNVDGRIGIRIHALNEAEQSEGCIGVGRTHTDTTIAQARDALTALCRLLVDAKDRQEGCELEIVEQPMTPTWAFP